MSVANRSSSATTYASRTNTVLTAPAGINNGDLLFIFFLLGAATPPTPTPPAGFTTIGGSYPFTATLSGFSVKCYGWYKVAQGESGNYTVTHATSSSQGYIGAYSGADSVTPVAPTPTGTVGTGATSTATGLTTTRDGSAVIYVGFDWGDTANNLTAPTGTTPTFTKRAGATTQSGVIFVADGTLATAGATGTKSITNNSTGTDPNFAGLVSIQPSGATSWQATAALNATAAAVWVGTQNAQGIGGFAGSGSVRYPGALVMPTTVGFPGSAGLVGAGTQRVVGSGSFAGSASSGYSGAMRMTAAAGLPGTAQFVETDSQWGAANGSLSGAAGFIETDNQWAAANGSLSGAGSVNAYGALEALASAGFAGSALGNYGRATSLMPTIASLPGSAGLAGVGTQTAAAQGIFAGSALGNYTGSMLMPALAGLPGSAGFVEKDSQWAAISGSLSGASGVNANVVLKALASAGLAGYAEFDGTLANIGLWLATALFGGGASLVGSPLSISTSVVVPLGAVATLNSSSSLTLQLNALMSGTGAGRYLVTLVMPTTATGMSASANFYSSVLSVSKPSLGLSGLGALAAAPSLQMPVPASLSATASLSAAARGLLLPVMSYGALGQFTSGFRAVLAPLGSFSGSGFLYAPPTLLNAVNFAVQGAGAIVPTTRALMNAAAGLPASAGFAEKDSQWAAISGSLSGAGSVNVYGLLEALASAGFSGYAELDALAAIIHANQLFGSALFGGTGALNLSSTLWMSMASPLSGTAVASVSPSGLSMPVLSYNAAGRVTTSTAARLSSAGSLLGAGLLYAPAIVNLNLANFGVVGEGLLYAPAVANLNLANLVVAGDGLIAATVASDLAVFSSVLYGIGGFSAGTSASLPALMDAIAAAGGFAATPTDIGLVASLFAGSASSYLSASSQLSTLASLQGVANFRSSVQAILTDLVGLSAAGGFAGVPAMLLPNAAGFLGIGSSTVASRSLLSVLGVSAASGHLTSVIIIPGQPNVWPISTILAAAGILRSLSTSRLAAPLRLAGAGGIITPLSQKWRTNPTNFSGVGQFTPSLINQLLILPPPLGSTGNFSATSSGLLASLIGVFEAAAQVNTANLPLLGAATTDLSGSGTVAMTAASGLVASTGLSGAGTVAVASASSLVASTGFIGNAELTPSIVTILEVLSILSGGGDLSSTLGALAHILQITSMLSGLGLFVSPSGLVMPASAVFDAAGQLPDVKPTGVVSAVSHFSGAGTVGVLPSQAWSMTASFIGNGTVGGSVGQSQVVTVAFAGNGVMDTNLGQIHRHKRSVVYWRVNL